MPMWPARDNRPRLMTVLNTAHWVRMTGIQPTMSVATVWPGSGIIYSPIIVREQITSGVFIRGLKVADATDLWDIGLFRSDSEGKPGQKILSTDPIKGPFSYSAPATPWISIAPGTYWMGVGCDNNNDHPIVVGALTDRHGPMGYYMETAFPLPDVATPVPVTGSLLLPLAGILRF